MAAGVTDEESGVRSSLKREGPLAAKTPPELRVSSSELRSYHPRTLKHDLQTRGRLPLTECLQIGRALTTALEHLHGHGLVHRDIKPSNVIFVNGVPKLADIGLVANIDATMSFVGTAGYVPPEGPGKPTGDIYSLGKLLYEISVGRDTAAFPELPTAWESFADQAGQLEDNQMVLSLEGYTYARMGRREEALAVLRRLEKPSPATAYVQPYFVARVHAALGDREAALTALEKACDDRSESLVHVEDTGGLRMDPAWEDLQAEPRFQQILKRTGLDKWPRDLPPGFCPKK